MRGNAESTRDVDRKRGLCDGDGKKGVGMVAYGGHSTSRLAHRNERDPSVVYAGVAEDDGMGRVNEAGDRGEVRTGLI